MTSFFSDRIAIERYPKRHRYDVDYGGGSTAPQAKKVKQNCTRSERELENNLAQAMLTPHGDKSRQPSIERAINDIKEHFSKSGLSPKDAQIKIDGIISRTSQETAQGFQL